MANETGSNFLGFNGPVREDESIMLDICPAKDTCIRSIAITIAVLKHYAIPAEPLPCLIAVRNPGSVRTTKCW